MGELYDENFFETETMTAYAAAQIILPYVIEKLKSKSIVDFGCGTGEWLLAAKDCNGIKHVLGIDGKYTKGYIKLQEKDFFAADLTKEVKFEDKFDLAISLEVAEHLPAESAEGFVHSLVQAADIVLFSAAVPCQHGTNHINEQYLSYWTDIFRNYGFVLCDYVRQKFWRDKRIGWHYRQNIVIYCKEELQSEVRREFVDDSSCVIDFIHPDAWEERNYMQYLFPFDLVNKGDCICIIGAGVVGQTYINQLMHVDFVSKIYWCDRNAEKLGLKSSVPCNIPENIDMEKVDKVIIAVLDENIAIDIKKNLLARKMIEEERIIWRNPKYVNNIV